LKHTEYDMSFIMERADRDDDLTLDVASVPTELTGVLEAGLPSFDPTAFLQLLRLELARANRYNFLVSLLLMRILPTAAAKCETERERVSELAHLLNATLRTTDFLGSLGNGIVGVITPHSDSDTAARLLQRLQGQSLFWAFRRRTGCDLRAAFAVYPTDATTVAALLTVAMARMREEVPRSYTAVDGSAT